MNNVVWIFIFLDGDSLDKNSKHDASERVLKPHERRALNFLINEYLLLQDYKLTSITFSDENPDQVKKFLIHSLLNKKNIKWFIIQWFFLIIKTVTGLRVLKLLSLNLATFIFVASI